MAPADDGWRLRDLTNSKRTIRVVFDKGEPREIG